MQNRYLVLITFIIIKFALQYLLISPDYELHRDEFLHIDQGKHLAWGYVSVPPFTSWTSWLILFLGGDEFWVRFFPWLFGALTILVAAKTVERLDGGLFAYTMALTALVFSPFTRLNIHYMPNSADVFFWTLLYYFMVSYVWTKELKWLYLASAAFAFGMLNKYNIAFLAAGIALAFLVSPQRKIFGERHLYFAAAISILLMLPHIFWQYSNGFPVIGHMRELAETQLVNVSRADFFKDQILFSLGFIFVIVAAFISLAHGTMFGRLRFVFWSYLFTIALFSIFRAKGYYALGLYPILIAFGSVALERWLSSGKWKMLKPALLAVPVLLFAFFVPLAFPVRTPHEISQHAEDYRTLGLLRWEDGKDHELPQDFADMLGWKQLARITDSAFAKIPGAASNTIVLCDNYGQAGAINYYSTHDNMHAVSFNADYINWFPEFKYSNAILVKEIDYVDMKNEIKLFESWYKAGEITNRFARESKTAVYVFIGAKADINKRIQAEKDLRKAGTFKE